ncbi:MAG: sulfotransferase [Synechococcales bacterium]|nr:sulfotransferase [Synechococcales bacterium]
MMNSLPLQFVNVGPQRTGTSWLHVRLQEHPSICLPHQVKETMFFDRDYDKGIAWYADYFSHRRPHQICGEIAPTYFDVTEVPARIRAVNPQCKIIIQLRHPVQRALSLYHHHLSKGRVSGSFSEAILQMPRIVEAGQYCRHICRWLDTFGADQVMFILLDDIESSPQQLLERLYHFLHLQPVEMSNTGFEKVGAATLPRYPWLAKWAAQSATWLRSQRLHTVAELGKAIGLKRIYTGNSHELPLLSDREQSHLLEQYSKDIDFVETLLGRDLSAWRKPS